MTIDEIEVKLEELRVKYKTASVSMQAIILAQAKALKNARNLMLKKNPLDRQLKVC